MQERSHAGICLFCLGNFGLLDKGKKITISIPDKNFSGEVHQQCYKADREAEVKTAFAQYGG